MENYILYVSLAAATICLPGPAVMLTLNNSVQKGRKKALCGILGIATAILCISAISATGLGIVLAQSAFAFSVIKFVGAVYLLYLGIRMWRSKVSDEVDIGSASDSIFRCFAEGFLVSISNPKAIVFFVSVFPQFIDASKNHTSQLFVMAVTFSCLVVLIHSIYSLIAHRAKVKLASAKNKHRLNKVSGGVFVGFAVGLASSSK
ncbi:amino acid transporter LysE [Vibrio zhanjiangensis]|uniref:Amino acid transporter LysE n=1 Tax=Vibrio zhanjiangensis TaxID=1046128 RepID=A0ABQ6EXA5_9VIBR|nr:LysE family translocator [Vibrio zhanjiangensis]GLT17150.1 amino acid transporter LysE [Vibrio zhanjiangensis]